MEKNDINPKELGPTLTLAQLYEAQNEYFDALSVYHKLLEVNQDEEILNKVKELNSKILDTSNFSYNKLIKSIFSDQDRKRFLILPAEKFNNYLNALKTIDDKEDNAVMENIDELAEETPVSMDISEKVDKQVITDINNNSSDKLTMKDLFNLSVSQLIEKLENYSNSDAKIGDLTLDEIADILGK